MRTRQHAANADLQKWLDDVMDLHGPKGLFDEAAERLWKDPENLETLWRGFLATHTLARDDRIENEFPDPDTYHDRPEGSHVTFVPPPPPAPPAKRPVEGAARVGRGGGARSVKRRRADPSAAEPSRRSDRHRGRSGPSVASPAKRADFAGSGAVTKPRRTTGTHTCSGRRPSAAN
ncbi:hypothetical protein TRAPUB_7639 [Trametes pubescens]|uniref:Uncharacterized protein n=1 Tax=Trametes pubescens TaxID=154538 RepID=A0A1M2V2U3_TRAPU|nr:hypothetical protein TRAPUB_7639 [Trametes pubescens]